MQRLTQQLHRSTLGKVLLFTLATVSPLFAADPKPEEIVKDMKRVADWQIENPSKHAVHDWTQAPFFLGLASLHQVTGDAKYLEALDFFGKQLSYGPGPRVTHADDHAVLQAWLEEYRLDKDPAKLNPTIAQFDKITAALANETPKSISGGSFTWCWCDALFMSPAVWAHLSQITGDPKYFAWADKEWWTTNRCPLRCHAPPFLPGQQVLHQAHAEREKSLLGARQWLGRRRTDPRPRLPASRSSVAGEIPRPLS
jgi:hypothetical protein